jgi:hypothetical protein
MYDKESVGEDNSLLCYYKKLRDKAKENLSKRSCGMLFLAMLIANLIIKEFIEENKEEIANQKAIDFLVSSGALIYVGNNLNKNNLKEVLLNSQGDNLA